jgi:uncharacterized protein YjbI with pentapeptide repeats
MIEDVKLDYMLFENDTFENVTFRKASFVHTILRNNVFLNCRFENVVFVSGEWVGNRYEGGELRGIHMGNVENPFSADTTGPMNTHVEYDTFVGVTVRDWDFARYPGEYMMGNLYFRNCSVRDNVFGNTLDTYGSIVMDSCEVKGLAWYPKNLVLRHCRMTGSQLISGRSGEGLRSDNTADLDSAVDVKVRGSFLHRLLWSSAFVEKYAQDVEIHGNSYVLLGRGRRVSVENAVNVSLRGSQDSVTIRSIRRGKWIYGLTFGRPLNDSADTLRHVDVRDVKTSNVVLGRARPNGMERNVRLVEDCVFKGIATDALDLSGAEYRNCTFEDIATGSLDYSTSAFHRCTFKNLRIVEKVLSLPDPPIFKDCVFENVHRDKGVKVWPSPTKGQSFGTDGPQEIRLPWESDEEWQRVQGEKEPSKPWWKLW